MNKKRRAIIADCQVSRLVTYTLGGYEQKVLLDGKYETNPVLLCLHGGPGMPMPFGAGSRGLFPEFTEHFIMAYWDQFGCGINNAPVDDSFTIDMFVGMTVDLIKALKKEFPDNKLFILGTSWGSVLAGKAAAMLPELVDSVLVYGQVLKDLSFNEEVYEALSDANISQKDKQRVSALRAKDEYTPKDIQFIAKLIRKHTEGHQAKAGGKIAMGPMIRGALTSPDYSFKDNIAVVRNGYSRNKSLWKELLHLDLRDTLREIQIPYRILQGGTDIVTSTKTVAEFAAGIDNNNLSFRIIENNGHIPGSAGMEETLLECIKMIQ